MLNRQQRLFVSSHTLGGVTVAEDLSCWPPVEAERLCPAVLPSVCRRVVMTGLRLQSWDIRWGDLAIQTIRMASTATKLTARRELPAQNQ